MIVAGVMSGTSADGINVALVRLRGGGFDTEFKLLAHYEFPYPPVVRRAILEMMNAEGASVARLSRLNFLLGELYADAVIRARQRARVKLDLVGCHGQTLYHQGERTPFLGSKVVATWQTGEAAVIAARVKVPVVSDFRPPWLRVARARRWCRFWITWFIATHESGGSRRTSAGLGISPPSCRSFGSAGLRI